MLTVSNLSIDDLLHDVSFEIPRGARVGLVGESGSGKSLTALSIMGLLPRGLRAHGSINFDGQELVGLKDSRMRRLRGKRVAMVFQEPMTALDPLMTIGRQLAEAAGSNARKVLREVGLNDEHFNRYPHQLSGGQRQRVLIGLAIAQDPDLLICDEPTTALDVIAQAHVLDLIDRLVEERGMSLLMVTHDQAVVRRMCDSVLTMSQGRVVDTPPAPEETITPAASRELGAPIIRLRDASVRFSDTTAVEPTTLEIPEGQRLGIVGGSGSGKTTLLKTIAGLYQPTTGSVDVDGSVQMVFQDPQSSLNPRLRVGASVGESCGGDLDRVREVLADVGLPGVEKRYPHEFSGGQRQRISIARALAPRPKILLADEPVSALDASARGSVLKALDDLVDEYGLTLVFVSHDLKVIQQVCDYVAVMNRGSIVEHGRTTDVLGSPQHDYTQQLVAAAL
ncbi:ATP-binding cassette domain-containing protein [Corynebacterium tapiri]|uniref:ATP-binding cassette domain-containing protein n=1 Tax=Corynebacterium tapiri TaxID=1448266 RepID=UPI001FEC3F60|nr:ABC transporter ATP-binding protein [Corynebacterium tapiri]